MLNLAMEYMSAVKNCIDLFDQKFGRRDLVRAWREGVIPQKGELLDNVRYQMHGVGCTVEYTDYGIDFDFASQYNIGFDAWRLWQYATQYPERYPNFQKLTAVENRMEELLINGTIRKVDSPYLGEGNDKLFELSL